MKCSVASSLRIGRQRALGWLVMGASVLSSCQPAEGDSGGSSGAPMVAGAGGLGGGAGTGGSSGTAGVSAGAGAGGTLQAGAGGQGATSAASGGGGGAVSGGASGTGGAAGDAGSNAAGTGQANGGAAGASSDAGQGGSAGQSGSGGAVAGGAGGTPAGDGGQSGAAGAAGGGAVGPFVCNQATGGKLISELYSAGLENGLTGSRWQLKWQDSAVLEEWANPQSSFWNAPIESACASDTQSPDRVVFMIFSWTITTQSDWRTKITQAVNNFKAKYPNLRRLDFMNQIVGPNNMLCPTPPAAGETILVSPELEAAMEEVAVAFPGFVFLNPLWEAASCADFQGGGPHLTVAGNMAAAGPVAVHFATTE